MSDNLCFKLGEWIYEYMSVCAGCISKALLQEMYYFLHFSAHMKYSFGVFQQSVYAYTITYAELADNTGALFVCM